MKRAVVLSVFISTLIGCAAMHPANDELVRAATVGDSDRVEAALAAGASPNAETPDGGMTALMLAARTGDLTSIEALLRKGANPNNTGVRGATALGEASSPAVVQVLLKAGAKPGPNAISSVQTTDGSCDADVLRELLAAGADVNAVGVYGQSPLMGVTRSVECTELLIDAGADVDAADPAGRTPLIVAVMLGSPEVARLLLARGADPNRRRKDGFAPLHLAATNPRPETISALIEASADLDAQTYDGRTALLLAAQNGYGEVVQVLLAAGADPNVRSGDGQTALSWAEAKHHTSVAEMLRKAAAQRGSGSGTAKRIPPGTLVVSTTDVTTDGRFARVRGRVTNTYTEQVRGIRYLVTIFPRDSNRVLDVLQHEVDTVVEPHDTKALRLDLESMYMSSEGRISIEAFPARIGGRDIDPPASWR